MTVRVIDYTIRNCYKKNINSILRTDYVSIEKSHTLTGKKLKIIIKNKIATDKYKNC